jgi:hypothetical protein
MAIWRGASLASVSTLCQQKFGGAPRGDLVEVTYRDFTATRLLANRELSKIVESINRRQPVFGLLRSVALSIIPFLLVLPVYPQDKSAPAKEENPYSKALLASIVEMEKSFGHIDDSHLGIRTNYHHMLVEKDPGITNDLPEQFGEYRVEYLDMQNQIARCKKLRKPFSILKIQPMKSEGARLKIQVTVYWIEYKKSKLNLALSDWSDVEFRFDCETQSFVISNVKLGGI